MAGADGSVQADEAANRLRELDDVLVAEIQALLEQLEESDGALESTQAALATAANVRAQVVALLAQQGVDAVRSIAEESAIDAANAVADDFDLGAFTPDMTATIELLVSTQMDDVTATFGDAAAQVGEAMRVGITSGAELAQLIEDVATLVHSTVARAQSAVDSAIMAAGRAIVTAGGEEGNDPRDPTVYRYVGPNDLKTRPFCEVHVGNCYSLERLDAEDNGDEQPKPVSVYLGGYNCRHSLAPMLKSEAIARGFQVFD